MKKRCYSFARLNPNNPNLGDYLVIDDIDLPIGRYVRLRTKIPKNTLFVTEEGLGPYFKTTTKVNVQDILGEQAKIKNYKPIEWNGTKRLEIELEIKKKTTISHMNGSGTFSLGTCTKEITVYATSDIIDGRYKPCTTRKDVRFSTKIKYL